MSGKLYFFNWVAMNIIIQTIKEVRMFYNIYLDNLKAPNSNEIFQEGYELLQHLACENADFIRSKTFPVIICRYATKQDVKIFKDLAEKYSWEISLKEITPNGDVFATFEEELVQKEQDDLHLMKKLDVINSLESGLSVLKERDDAVDDFNDSKETSKGIIMSYYENINAKFKIISIYAMFIMWLAISGLLCFSSLYSWEDKIFFASCLFCVMIPGSIIYDYITYRKNKKHYTSSLYIQETVESLSKAYMKKNNSVHVLEELIDSLQARNCLVILPYDKRNMNDVEYYLVELKTNKSIDEIFALH